MEREREGARVRVSGKIAFIIRPRARRRSQKQWENESHDAGPARWSTTFGCRSRIRLKASSVRSGMHTGCIYGYCILAHSRDNRQGETAVSRGCFATCSRFAKTRYSRYISVYFDLALHLWMRCNLMNAFCVLEINKCNILYL